MDDHFHKLLILFTFFFLTFILFSNYVRAQGTDSNNQYKKIVENDTNTSIAKDTSNGWVVVSDKIDTGRIQTGLCNSGDTEDCARVVQLERRCSDGRLAETRQYSTECNGEWKSGKLVPCFNIDSKIRSVSPYVFINGSPLDINCSSSMPLLTPSPSQNNACVFPVDEEQKRQEIMADISRRYKFKIVDTNMCEVKDCVNNTKWSVADLEEIRKTLDSLPKCFTDKLNLDKIGGRVKVDQNEIDIFNPEALFKEALQESCCSPDLLEDKGCYWGGTLPSVMIFCGDRYRNISPTCKKASEKLGLTFAGLLVHEMTHAFQNKNIYLPPQVYDTLLVKSWNIVTGWICIPFFGCKNLYENKIPTTYAGVSPLEDMSESARLYYENPDELKKISPERYNFVKNNIMCGKEFGGNK